MNTAARQHSSSDNLAWFKSSYSGSQGGDCLEVATTPATVHVRDSKSPTGPTLALSPSTWREFVHRLCR
ncbi:hypothetical protein GCM10010503_60460 [Streptomyces lucensis JCM 4490]|uniref:DUF397 domain-containing protein n=1 Tax=Streptomyces lucensis JCM 4490 TaxID=1306176 RepID=A0A918JD46_9ACTN|nr:DUF397 domain-containing protein [Streptomyces lucensis]GGW74707.1 hypothetical protein GCM10010503_60460 [Streptomyces lucensis JCM 4490]